MNTRMLALLTAVLLLHFSDMAFSQDRKLVFSTHVEQGTDVYQATFEILEEAFKRIGYSFEMKSYPGKRALALSNSGKTDGEAHRIYGIVQDYQNLVRIPEIQQIIYNYAYATKPITLENGWVSIKPYRVAVEQGSIFVTDMSKKYAKSVEEIGSFESIFKFVSTGRADLAIGTPFIVNKVLRKPAYQEMGFIRIEPPLSALPIFAYLNKKHHDLAPLAAKAMHEMKMDGSYTRIMRILDE